MVDKTYFIAGGLDCVVPLTTSSYVFESTTHAISGFSFVTINATNGSPGFSCPFIDQDTGAAADLTAFWTHFVYAAEGGNDGNIMQMLDSSHVPQVQLQVIDEGGSADVIVLQYKLSGSWTTVSTFNLPLGVNAAIDIYVNAVTLGSLDCFVNGSSVASFSGDLSGLGTIASLTFAASSQVDLFFQQILVANYNTIGHTVRARQVTAAGDSQQWTGAYGNVATYPMNTGLFIASATAGDLNTYTGTTLSATPTGQIIRAVGFGTYIRNDTVGPQNAKGVLEISSTPYTAPYNMRSISLGFNGNIAIWANNPATSAPWASITEANCDFGIESVA